MIKIRAQIPIASKGVILHIILIILVVRTGFEPVSPCNKAKPLPITTT